jgi:hypothetical protein
MAEPGTPNIDEAFPPGDLPRLISAEEGVLITKWAKTACSYIEITEQVVAILSKYFRNAAHMNTYEKEIKSFLRQGLPDADRHVLAETDATLGIRNQSPEQASLKKKRGLILQKLNRLYTKLRGEAFPSFLPDTPSPVHGAGAGGSGSSGRGGGGGGSCNSAAENRATDELMEELANERQNLDGKLAAAVEEMNIGEKKASSRVPPNVSHNRWNPKKQRTVSPAAVADLYQTPLNAVIVIVPKLIAMFGIVGTTIFEPAAGYGAIVNPLRNAGFEVIDRDLFTMDEKHDYLTTPDPDYTVAVINPPFKFKTPFFRKALASRKPFIMLLPIQFMTAVKNRKLLKGSKWDIIVLNPAPLFKSGQKFVKVGDVAWFFVNTPGACGHTELAEIGNDDEAFEVERQAMMAEYTASISPGNSAPWPPREDEEEEEEAAKDKKEAAEEEEEESEEDWSEDEDA